MTDEPDKLKPCPFCGHAAEIYLVFGTYYARCTNIECAPAAPSTSWELCKQNWNHRAEMNTTEWLPSDHKPPNLPGEHHSADVLIQMQPTHSEDHGIYIGHVSLGHWRPRGGNGNFDDRVLGWMPLPQTMTQDKKGKQ